MEEALPSQERQRWQVSQSRGKSGACEGVREAEGYMQRPSGVERSRGRWEGPSSLPHPTLARPAWGGCSRKMGCWAQEGPGFGAVF